MPTITLKGPRVSRDALAAQIYADDLAINDGLTAHQLACSARMAINCADVFMAELGRADSEETETSDQILAAFEAMREALRDVCVLMPNPPYARPIEIGAALQYKLDSVFRQANAVFPAEPPESFGKPLTLCKKCGGAPCWCDSMTNPPADANAHFAEAR